MAQNLIEKIAQRYATGLPAGQEIHSGDYIAINPAYVMTHDNTGAVIPKFNSIGAKKLANPRQVVHTLDHNIQDTSEKNLQKYRNIEQFSKAMGADFYPAGRGIGHQIMCEEGYVWPHTMVVASDSHSNMYGGLGCLGTPVVRTDAAAIWASGKTWWQVPPVVRVLLNGRLQAGVTGKDVIITLAGIFNEDQVLNHAIEFSGEGISSLSVDQRLTIANMTTEWGALAGVFPVDEVTLDWLRARIAFIERRGRAGVASDTDGMAEHPRLNRKRLHDLENNPLNADAGAYYASTLSLNLDSVRPHVCGPNTVKVISPVAEIEKQNITIQKAYLVSCVNSRTEDIAQAARVVRGKKIAEHVDFYIAAASSEVQQQCEQNGDWQTLLNAGARPLPPGCGPCIGLGTGLLEDGQVGISATNRNFKGRMGSRDALAYLASPAVVAASALAGKIAQPEQMSPAQPEFDIVVHEQKSGSRPATTILEGFPEEIVGELVFCYQDNLNTDGIYPGKYTYLDDITPQKQALVVMENYDPEFAEKAGPGDILVGGFNFGTGSSREQAATALKYKGLAMVIAGSFSETYKRNAINNGFLVIECPLLVNDLKNKFGTDELTVCTQMQGRVNFSRSVLEVDGRTYPINPVGAAAQEIIIAGGLESWVIQQLK